MSFCFPFEYVIKAICLYVILSKLLHSVSFCLNYCILSCFIASQALLFVVL